jgi:hypothetical protein
VPAAVADCSHGEEGRHQGHRQGGGDRKARGQSGSETGKGRHEAASPAEQEIHRWDRFVVDAPAQAAACSECQQQDGKEGTEGHSQEGTEFH